MALKPILSKAAISEMRGHKWWIMRNYSDGKETSELYSMFINVDVNRTSATPYNTVIVSWSPKAFSWGVITKLIKFIEKDSYPKKGEVIRIIPVLESRYFSIVQLTPQAFPSNWSRLVWYTMQGLGWSVVKQGETYV
jgi:hypothetical protein